MNNLDKFYKGTSVTTEQHPVPPVPPVCTKTNNGVAADELPHTKVVTDSVKRTILGGKYINLACLLIPDFGVPSVAMNDMNGLEFLKKDRRDHRLDRALTITQFTKAFGVYKRVICEAYPLRRNELDLFEADIGNIYEHILPVSCAVLQTSSAYLKKGIKVDWSKRHKDLFQLIVGV